MRKNIKKIIAVITVTVSIFILTGCGQTKETSKQLSTEEIKQEIKTETESKNKEAKDITEESLSKFKGVYEEYKLSLSEILNLDKQSTEEGYIPTDKAKELKAKSDLIKDKLIEISPNDKTKRYAVELTNYYDEYFRVYTENDTSKMKPSYSRDMKNNLKIIDNEIEGIKTQLANK